MLETPWPSASNHNNKIKGINFDNWPYYNIILIDHKALTPPPPYFSCGKLFQTQVEIEYHAAKSGHSNFSESVEEKKPLTEEEKAEKLRKVEDMLKQKRKDREEKEKLEALEREKIRIKAGKEMIEAKKR